MVGHQKISKNKRNEVSWQLGPSFISAELVKSYKWQIIMKPEKKIYWNIFSIMSWLFCISWFCVNVKCLGQEYNESKFENFSIIQTTLYILCKSYWQLNSTDKGDARVDWRDPQIGNGVLSGSQVDKLPETEILSWSTKQSKTPNFYFKINPARGQTNMDNPAKYG